LKTIAAILFLAAHISAFAQGFTFRDAGFVGAGGSGTGSAGGGGEEGGGLSSDYLNPLAYYDLDEATPGPAEDQTSGNRDLAYDTGSQFSVAGKIGSAYSMSTVGVSSSDAGFEMSGADWAIRFWFYREVEQDRLILLRSTSQTGNGFEVDSDSSSGLRVKFFIGGSGGASVLSAAMSTSAWHRIVIYHDHGTEIGIRVDDGTWTTQAFTSTMATVSTAFTLQKLTSGVQHLDEIAIWKGYIPTDEEITYDWNSGDGRTYPLE
jgi:hypothetical protein